MTDTSDPILLGVLESVDRGTASNVSGDDDTRGPPAKGATESDLLFFLDFDLAVLTRPNDGYQLYARQIRSEYAHLPDETFRSGRAKVLRHLMSGEHIFFTDLFRLQESRAIENMRGEVNALETHIRTIA
eukprot:TRINITY_DN1241_c0_g1_i2.p1 TRINITY_DN1241_c0_g1~~TRINITY_DN1241_c0_g1_i2.p1  ORF type:complete len:130 (-),score=28.59 TRINITY_DN1241_c0_g1_i2:82-471(-)